MKDKDIKDYLHLYLGCDTDKGKLIGIEMNKAICMMNDNSVVEGNIYNLKPILRPLSSMTEEEKHTLFDAMFPNGMGGATETGKETFIEYLLDLEMSDHSSYAEQIMGILSIKHIINCANWLRSNYFDADGLIESNLAVASNK